MKSLEEAVQHCFAIPKGTPREFEELAVKNLADTTQEVVSSQISMDFIGKLASLGKEMARHRKGKKRDVFLSLILQEMEKQR